MEHGSKVDTVQLKSSQLSWAGQYKKCVQYDFKFTLEYSAVKSSQLSWAGQYKKCVQYGFQFTTEYSAPA